MTLGEPQPLSRRQARELARAQGEQVAVEHDAAPTVDVPELTPAALRPASLAGSARTESSRTESSRTVSSRRSSRHHSVEASEPSEESEASGVPVDSGAPAEAPAPVRADASARSEPIDSASAPPTLSRRQLRALRASDEQEEAAPVEAAPVEAVTVEAELIEPEASAAEAAESVQMHAEPILGDQVDADNAASNTDNAWIPPVGHWSVDTGDEPAEVPPPDQSLDQLINRGIGAGGIPTTTNALILPAIPHQGSSVSPISNTGEIMITGSFDLPRSLGSTGASPSVFDSSEMDHIVDQLDVDQLVGDSAPVSASRAVSTHSSTRGMLTPPKKQRASLPMVLVITTAALAVSVLGLLTGYLLGVF